ncbi:MAG: hypothetical protein WEC59_09515, partial [Salibacteraceae bacterium]
MKRILNIARWLIGVTLIFVLLVAAVTISQESVLRAVVVNIDYAGENYFIEKEELEESIFDLGYVLDSTAMSSIDPANIEHMLENNAFISDAEVYKELNGKLHLDVRARKPVVRVFNDLGISVYIDEEGVIMPLSSHYSSRVMVANGAISLMLHQFIGKNVLDLLEDNVHPEAEILANIFKVASFTAKDDFWNAQFNQVFINEKKEIELIPRVGDHQIQIGKADDLEEKLNKL